MDDRANAMQEREADVGKARGLSEVKRERVCQGRKHIVCGTECATHVCTAMFSV